MADSIDITKCFKIVKELGSGLSDDQIKELILEAQKYQGQLQEYFKKKRGALVKEKLSYAQEVKKLRDARDFLGRFKDKKEGLLALLSGQAKEKSQGGFAGVDQVRQVHRYRWSRMFVQGLKKDGLIELAMSGTMNRDVYRASFLMGLNKHLPADIPSQAVQIAKVIKAVNDDMFLTLRRAGSLVGYDPTYIHKGGHDPLKMMKPGEEGNGFEAWATYLFDRLDVDRTFGVHAGDKVKIMEIMQTAWNNIHEGKFGLKAAGMTDELVTMSGSKNTLAKVDAERVFWFKSGEDYFDYNQMYGHSDLWSAMIRSIDQNSRASALIERLGRNPNARLLRLAQEHEVTNRNNEVHWHPRNTFHEIRGYTGYPGKTLKAQVARGIRAWNNMSLMGFSAMASISDIGFAGAIKSSITGENFLQAHSKLALDWLQKLPKGQREAAAERIGYMTHNYLGFIYDRIGDSDYGTKHGPSWLRFLIAGEKKMFEMNFLNTFTDASRTTMAVDLSMYLGSQAGKSWDQLPARLKSNFKMYDISEVDWERMRKAAGKFSDDMNTTAIVPEDVENLDFGEFLEDFTTLMSTGWKGLSKVNRAKLKMLGISSKAWTTMRKSVKRGRTFTLDTIDAMSDSVVAKHMEMSLEDVPAWKESMKEKLAKFGNESADAGRRQLSTKLSTMLMDVAHTGSPTPTARDSAILMWGTHADDWNGTLVRLGTQYLSFPLAALTSGKRALMMSSLGANTHKQALKTPEGLQALLTLILVTTGLGYLNWSAREIAAGRTPPNPLSPEVFLGSMVRGGALGIYGDYLLATHSTQEAMSRVLGPTGSKLARITDAALKAKREISEKGDVSKGTKRVLKSVTEQALRSVPFTNLPYTKFAYERLFFEHVNEVLNPGSHKRMTERLKRRGQIDLLGD